MSAQTASTTPSAHHRPTVLVTGGAGFIGTNLIRHLLGSGAQVTVFDNFSSGRADNLASLPVSVVQGDILNADDLHRAVQGNEWIVHLAAQTGVPASVADPFNDCTVNIMGTLNLLEAVRESTGRSGMMQRVVFASSNAVLGRQSPPAAEDKVPLPVSPYGASKLAAEAYCLAYEHSWHVPTVVLRFANVYGPFSTHKESVVARFVRQALSTRGVTIYGDGQQTRDFIFVEDLCRAIELALRSEVSGEVFQIATGRETSINTLVDLVEDALGITLNRSFEPTRPGDVEKNYSLIAKASRLLGWRPSTTLADGLHQTVEWFTGSAQSPELSDVPASAH